MQQLNREYFCHYGIVFNLTTTANEIYPSLKITVGDDEGHQQASAEREKHVVSMVVTWLVIISHPHPIDQIIKRRADQPSSARE